jgi:serine/threonine protein kinase
MNMTARQTAIAPEMGKYHLIAELARGGMGNVYLAALCGPGGFNKLLVLKELKPELSDDETYVAMFLEEARLAARLVHPNIVQTNEVSSEDKRHYMTMEYLDGRSLSRVVRRFAREGGFPIGAQLRIIGDALLGLHYAHELRGFDGEPLGIVHRDVSPLNLMVTFDGQAKLLDFGIAKAVDSSLETKAGVLKGRIAYMAPEQACSSKIDRRADIYSMGVLLWEAAAGRRLWPGMSEVEILSRVLREGAPRLREVLPDAPQALDAICARAMARDCEDRYATAAELLEDLEAHLAHRDDKMPMRQIGELISVTFAEERHKMNLVIEETIARVGSAPPSGPRSGVMPTFRTQVVGTPSKAWPVRGEPASISQRVLPAPTTDYAPAILSTQPSMLDVRSVATRLQTGYPPIYKRVAVVASAIGMLVACGIVFSAAHRGAPGQSPGSAAPAPPPAQIAAPPPYEEPEGVDRAAHSAAPSPAQSATTPPRQRVLPAAAPPPPHPTRRVPQQTPSSVPQTEVPSAPPAAARPEVSPAGGRAPLRPIVTSNPYGSQ